MLYEQQKYYLEYMQEYGGQLTDEKENAILSLYSEAEAAKQLQSDILEKTERANIPLPKNLQTRCGRYPT